MASSDFSTDVARELPGPAWLTARRVAAAEALGDLVLPSTDEEVWRYSRIADLDLDRYTPRAASTAPAFELQPADAAFAGRIVVVDGVVVFAELAPELVSAGVFAGRLVDHPDAASLLGSVLAEPTDVFARLNDAFTVDPVAVVVPAGVRIEQPIVVEHVTMRADHAVFPRIVVRAGADSAVTVLDSQHSGDAAALVVPVTELHADRAARIGYGNVQQLGTTTWQIASHVARAEADSTIVASTAALGGEYARVRTDCRLVGAGATGDLVSLYFGNGDQTLDFRTFQDHAAPHTTSNLLFKGVVDDQSKSVYTGLIRVRKNAHGTNAFQTNRNLKLSDDAWAESVPNLEIENNDVHCSHASTVGPIDEDQRFYLESRGVPPEAAERLVVAGFFAEVLDRLPVPSAVPMLRDAIAAKLDAHGAEQRMTVTTITIARADEIAPGTARRFDVDGHHITVVRIDDDFYAIGDTCTHADYSLAEGEIDPEERTVECWKHGALFSLETGEALTLPATRPTPVYEVVVDDGDLQVVITDV